MIEKLRKLAWALTMIAKEAPGQLQYGLYAGEGIQVAAEAEVSEAPGAAPVTAWRVYLARGADRWEGTGATLRESVWALLQQLPNALPQPPAAE